MRKIIPKNILHVIFDFFMCMTIITFLLSALNLIIKNQDFITVLFSVIGCCFLIIFIIDYVFNEYFKGLIKKEERNETKME